MFYGTANCYEFSMQLRTVSLLCRPTHTYVLKQKSATKVRTFLWPSGSTVFKAATAQCTSDATKRHTSLLLESGGRTRHVRELSDVEHELEAVGHA